MATRKRKAVWDKKPPSKSAHTHLTAARRSEAKAAAERAGRPYPNLVDNMRAAKKARAAKKSTVKRRAKKKSAGKKSTKKKSVKKESVGNRSRGSA